MMDTLLCVRSLLIHALQSSCSSQLLVRSTGVVDNPSGRASKVPLLTLELVLSTDGRTISYSVATDAIHGRIMALFDRAISKLQVSMGLIGMGPFAHGEPVACRNGAVCTLFLECHAFLLLGMRLCCEVCCMLLEH